ncbi:hypothetical protein VaNZ11_006741 [Volvox africanus]|uniref:Reverse transcriptase domain-containing protein n=1 Tax=Volvox africanus TaxID=51714 RepID=A0ABQ5S305_9CHLO|nr:hypothetical protein VaNZ11_006741 [Volvox africanus]
MVIFRLGLCCMLADMYDRDTTGTGCTALRSSSVWAVIVSKLDLRQGFLQIPIRPDDQPKAACWVVNKLIIYTRMPYRLKNASAKFQRIMDYELVKAGLDEVSVAFIDDVLIWSETPEQHVRDVERVLDALHACGLRAHPDKLIFGADLIEYLGHNLSPTG